MTAVRVARLLVLVGLSAATPLPATAQEPIREVVHELLTGFDGGWSEVPALHAALVALGEPAVDPLFTVLAGDGPASPAGPPLGAAPRLAATMALEDLPIAAVRRILDRVAKGPPAPARRRCGLELLARFGAPSDLGRSALLAVGDDGGASYELREAYRTTAEQILARTPGFARTFCSQLVGLDRSLQLVAVEAVASLGGVGAFEPLARALGHDDQIDAMVLVALARLDQDVRLGSDAIAVLAVRDALRSEDQTVVALAAGVLATLGDVRSMPDLIETLEGASGAARGAVRGALRDLAHVDLGASVREWRVWYQAQLDWLATEAEELTDDLADGSPGAAQRAIQLLAARPVLRDEVAARLVVGLSRNEDPLLVATCGALGHVGSTAGLEVLVGKLDHSSAAVRSAAQRALVRITGLDLPAERAAWEGRINLSPNLR